ncbi:ornithine cyclodeaminase family protein [Sphingomonas sp. 35-24ZXX]|uniref:ornithine cyclodeaminase family protein n=1 Tax=Sphingomonas sp. 35-24ZXX TaxID=1545915 RepID=UPI00053C069F|nr:ornithine cyclodeaminase family protein [Sphingomonas sp. 35-24ZXX]
MTSARPAFYDAQAVARWLDFPGGVAAMRAAMLALSGEALAQPQRSIIPVGDAGLFGVMPGSFASTLGFGAKLVGVFPDAARAGRSRHHGIVALFNAASGAIIALADAEALTTIRTACATVAATQALARHDSQTLAIFGCGTQARSHIAAFASAMPMRETVIWGRDSQRAEALAQALRDELGIVIRAEADGRAAAQAADIICTVSGSATPILLGEWIRPGTHVNLVGSSYLGPSEADSDLVCKSRYIADYRSSALAAAAEFAIAREAGLVDETHIVAEIGEVFSGSTIGRRDDDDITLYKSLGHVAQDLGGLGCLHRRAVAESA